MNDTIEYRVVDNGIVNTETIANLPSLPLASIFAVNYSLKHPNTYVTVELYEGDRVSYAWGHEGGRRTGGGW